MVKNKFIPVVADCAEDKTGMVAVAAKVAVAGVKKREVIKKSANSGIREVLCCERRFRSIDFGEPSSRKSSWFLAKNLARFFMELILTQAVQIMQGVR